MKKEELKQTEIFCREIARKAGEAIMEVYNDATLFNNVEFKSDASPLTLADKAANKIIVSALKEKYPGHAVLSEEEKDDLKRLENKLCFVVDPLDGTKEFIKRNGQFTVNIALAENNKSVMGVIYVPATKELFYASKGYGSFFEAEGESAVRILATDETDLKKVRLVMSSSHSGAQADALIEKYNFKNFVKMGSSLKGCLIAKGEAEIYYRHGPTMEWDTAAMQCIAEEAGAIFLQMDGSEMTYNRENSLNDKGFFIVNRRENILQDMR